ncbi:MAG: biotin--[acetyl-CoA-carboxylase] ligase [Clostridiales bacterium]|nr:biotin--[acetyl-CoA-carboxylase] ligase [Clostridiales bacterium]
MAEVDSTNNEVKRRAAAGAAEGLAVIAGAQSGGRGRRGRAFQSLPGKGLYLSVLLRPRVPAVTAALLTAHTALAVCDGIEACCGVRPGIKWVNDIILAGKKVCGILAEMEGIDAAGLPAVAVLGIGINISQTSADFGPALSPTAISLEDALGHPVDSARLTGCLLAALSDMYRAFPGGGALERYRADCLTLGRQVCFRRGEETVTAFAETVTPSFGLVVRYPSGNRGILTAGEVSVRGLLGYL